MRRVVLAFAVVGCSHPAEVEAPKPVEIKTDRIQITDGEMARTHSERTKHTSLPFAFELTGVNGTQLMRQFLGYAEQHGARYASNLRITLQMMHDGIAVECVSKVVFDKPAVVADKPAAPAEPDEYTTTIKPWQPAQVKAEVDEHDYICEKHARQVLYEERMVVDRNDAEVKRYVYPEDNKIVTKTKLEYYDDCHLEPRHRAVTRYEHFIAAHFEPPDWTLLSRAYSESKLVELPPECHQIPTPDHMVQRVDADLSYTGALADKRVSDPEPVPQTEWTLVHPH